MPRSALRTAPRYRYMNTQRHRHSATQCRSACYASYVFVTARRRRECAKAMKGTSARVRDCAMSQSAARIYALRAMVRYDAQTATLPRRYADDISMLLRHAFAPCHAMRCCHIEQNRQRQRCCCCRHASSFITMITIISPPCTPRLRFAAISPLSCRLRFAAR